MSRSRRDTATSSSGNSDLSSPLAIARTFSFDDNIETIGYCFKGGLVSESFYLWVQSPTTKKVPNHYPVVCTMYQAKVKILSLVISLLSDLATFF